jgi:DNA-directed RNA polymerase specialized sigma24 family protein
VQDIVDSYRPGPRYRRVWLADGDEDFLDCGEELETKATCYGEADVAAIQQQIEDSPSFSMMGTPGVLAGVHLLVWRQQKRREQEFEDYKPTPKRKKGKKGATVEAPKPRLRRVSFDELEARYNTWLDDKTEENWNALWEDAHALFFRLATRDHSEDGGKLRNAERDVELVSDFLIAILSALKNGGRIANFKHYLSRAWKRRRIDALKALKEWDRKHVRDIPTDDEDDDDERAVTYSDAATFQSWEVEQREGFEAEPSDEEREQERETKFSQLDADLADFAGVWLTGVSEKELSSRFGLSRQAVGRRKRKVEKALTVPAAVEVDR